MCTQLLRSIRPGLQVAPTRLRSGCFTERILGELVARIQEEALWVTQPSGVVNLMQVVLNLAREAAAKVAERVRSLFAASGLSTLKIDNGQQVGPSCPQHVQLGSPHGDLLVH